MKPSSLTGGLTFEGGKDRKYARAAARRVGSQVLKQTVNAGENRAWDKLFHYKADRVSSSEISGARMWGFALNHKFTEFKSNDGVVEEIGRDFANDYIGSEPTELAAELVPTLEDGLTKIATGSTVRALLSLTRRKVAAEMLENIRTPVLEQEPKFS